MTIRSAPDALEGGGAPLEGPHGPIGVLVCGHGSRNRLAVEEFASLARQLQHLCMTLFRAPCRGACLRRWNPRSRNIGPNNLRQG